MTLLRSLLGVALVQVCFCRTYYRDRMPNGYSVPNPCQTSAIWEGAGHFNPFHHTHLKNSFGNVCIHTVVNTNAKIYCIIANEITKIDIKRDTIIDADDNRCKT